MRIEVLDGEAGWPVVEALDGEVWPPDVMTDVVWRDVVWSHADRRVVVWEGERVVAHVGVFHRDGTLDGARTRMCGIGGVMTAPSERRKGYAGAAMRRAAQHMDDEGVDFGLLFCEPHNVKLYGDLGWRVFHGKVRCTQPSGPMIFDMMPTMILPIRTTPARGEIDLCGLPW
jgi:predicted acetyltransferase